MRTLCSLLFFGWMVLAQTAPAQTTLFFEDFDGVTAPDAPPGWTFGDGWDTDPGVASSGSGLNNLRHSGSGTGSAETPVIDLNGVVGANLSYLARRTSSYDPANLRVVASNDGGLTFPLTILGAGSAVPASTSYDSVGVALPASLIGSSAVVLRFEGFGLSSSSANARIDDLTITSSTDPPPPDPSVLEFSTAETSALAGDTGIQVPIQLTLNPIEGLQGLQFRVSWDLDSLSLTNLIRGPAISDAATWTLDFEPGAQQADVVLLGSGTAALPAGSHEPLVTLEFAAGAADVTQMGSIRLVNVVSALPTAEGDDAGVIPGGDHPFTLTGRVANFVASALNLDLGIVEVGSPDSVLFTVSNPDGQTDLEITSTAVSNHLFSILPGAAVVPPNESQDFYVFFAPTMTEFGRQNGEIVFYHNAQGDSTIIFLTGKGHSGRGDAEGDGTVDALDVVHAIDYVLSRLSPSPVQIAASDLFPFPAGDLAIDVRDLTVLTQAIAHGQWPDGIALPIEETTTTIASSAVAHVLISPNESQRTDVQISHNVPLRSLQLVFPAEQDLSSGIRIEGMTVVTGYDVDRRELRVLAYVADGGAVPAGKLRLTVPGEVGVPRFASAVDDERERMRVDASVSTGTLDPKDQPAPRLAPFPNPYRPDAGVLSFGMTGRVLVYDLLGREIFAAEQASTWDGRDVAGRVVAPGLYIVQTELDDDRQSRPITVVR